MFKVNCCSRSEQTFHWSAGSSSSSLRLERQLSLCLWLIAVPVSDTAVEQRKRPELRGKPVAVVQHNSWKGGGLIAVSYEARKCGVLR